MATCNYPKFRSGSESKRFDQTRLATCNGVAILHTGVNPNSLVNARLCEPRESVVSNYVSYEIICTHCVGFTCTAPVGSLGFPSEPRRVCNRMSNGEDG